MAMKTFFDRHNELLLLSERYEKLNAGELCVLFGRRRIGKTELLLRFLEKSDCKKLYLYVNISEKSELMEQFSRDIKEQVNDTLRIRDWKDFFQYLFEESKNKKFIVVIDEFQRFSRLSKDFISMLQSVWDTELKQNKIMIVLLGSSMGMTHDLVFSAKGPLYGRATVKKKINPFRYVDFREMFFNLKSEKEKIEFYSVFGGTPYYLDAAKKENKSLFETITNLVLDEDGRLFDEPTTLLSSELRSFNRHNSILLSIAKGKYELKEIADQLNMEQTQITPHIHHLINLLDIVYREEPIFGKKRRSRYLFKDNFFRFWYRFVFPNKSSIELKNYPSVIDRIRDSFIQYNSKIFEDVIKELLVLYNGKKISGYPLNFEKIGSWWEKGDEIDIICYNKREILVGEVKWKNKLINGLSVFNDMEDKVRKLSFGGRVKYLIVSKSGFEADTREVLEKKGVICLDLTDVESLFNEITEFEKYRQKTLLSYA